VSEMKNTEEIKNPIIMIPDVVLNPDGLLLDGLSCEDIESALDLRVKIIGRTGDEFVKTLTSLLKKV
jgi:hypothetical protein